MKWEYLIVEDQSALWKGHLDDYGADGWELVTVIGEMYHGNMCNTFYFKRPLPIRMKT